jgi:ABC-type cobalamin transport system ATPase subunit
MLSEETLAKVYGIKVKIANISGQKAIISKLNE